MAQKHPKPGANVKVATTPDGRLARDLVHGDRVQAHKGRTKGKPAIHISLKAVKGLGELFCTLGEIATGLGMQRSALYQRMAQQPEIREAIEEGRRLARTSLRRQLMARMLSSDRVLIHMAEQHLGHAKKLDIGGNPEKPIELDIDARRRRLTKAMRSEKVREALGVLSDVTDEDLDG